MFRPFDGRAGHHVLLLLAWAVLCLPNLGGPSLFDVDEGRNADAAHIMWVSGNYIVPFFNGVLRVDKPALLYWLQAACYEAFGLNEFAARLPSALASLVAVLATYELGRRMFGAAAGLLAGLILTSSVLFCAAAHFANPDALLNACMLLTLLLFWTSYARGGRGWLVWPSAAAGLAVLAKGPVGLVLPGAAVVLFLLWERRLRRLWDVRLLGGVLLFILVAAPWYVWVGVETKWEWVIRFWTEHNEKRFMAPMENHSGPFVYYLLVLIVGLAPWSVFLGLTGWHSYCGLRARDGQTSALRFLTCWIVVYLAFFTLAGTKLPNYILPLYPAAALLTARFLDHWRRGLARPPAWTLHGSLACLALMGVGVTAGLLVAGGAVQVSFLRGRSLPGLEAWAGLGVLLILGCAAAVWYARRQCRGRVLSVLTVTAVLFTGVLAAYGGSAVERHKAPRALVEAMPADQTFREVRVAAYEYFQPSLVFYCRRDVPCLESERQAVDFLRGPLPSYLVLPVGKWDELREKVGASCRLLARRYDLYTNEEVVLVTNE
jgi:4-amino-4-deoxy-L-arabinose transferase-like glycosyltransferase